ncbi:unnamed protein product [Lactuca virosa]|uniref:Helicase ATP-binding domain-containing protein n=1 Tax=Lactuca virosa TaxID=75947 RepID=A0AAU9MUS3_9ASTR|nr:unnamed protein product [Lactuca virosa]
MMECHNFWSRLLSTGICLVAVDEAHCISEVEYKQLYKLRDVLVGVPFVGLTATTTEKVQNDIVGSLMMKDPHDAIGSFDRKNIYYGVKYINRGASFVDELMEQVSKHVSNDGSTIVYCTTIKDVQEVIFHILLTLCYRLALNLYCLEAILIVLSVPYVWIP